MKSTQVLSLWRKPVAGLALTILIAFTILSSGVAAPAESSEGLVLNYELGKTYTYVYETKSVIKLVGTSDEESQVLTKGQAQLTPTKKNDFVLTLGDFTLDVTSPNEKVAAPIGALKGSSSRFTTEGGLIKDFYVKGDESAWVVNYHRAIVSIFNNYALQDSQLSQAFYLENDVSGTNCPTEYQITSDGTFTKRRDLNKCRNRDGGYSEQYGVPYTSTEEGEPSSDTSIRSSQECVQKFDGGILNVAECNEVHRVTLLSSGKDSGGNAKVTAKIQFKSVGSGQAPTSTPTKLSTLLFDHAGTDLKRTGEEAGIGLIEGLTGKLCLSTGLKGRLSSNTASAFLTLKAKMRFVSKKALEDAYEKLKSGKVCEATGDHRKQLVKLYVDAAAMAGSPDSIAFVADLIKSGQVSKNSQKKFRLFTSFANRPAESALESMKTLISTGTDLSPKYLLAASGIAYQYCLSVKGECESSKAYVGLVNEIAKQTRENCGAPGSSDQKKLKAATIGLQALGNLDSLTAPATAAIASCLDKSDRLKIHALQAIRRDPCQEPIREAARKLLINQKNPSHIRISAYLAISQCYSKVDSDAIRAFMKTEDSIQVLSFLKSHRGNAWAVSRDEASIDSGLFEGLDLEKFGKDPRKFSSALSYSNEMETYSANMIYSEDSFLPKIVYANSSTKMYGQDFGLIEVGAHLGGLEQDIMERMFGPNGENPTTFQENTRRRPRRQATGPTLNQNEIEVFHSQVKPVARKTEPSDVYIRVFGTTVYATSLTFDNLLSSPKGPADPYFSELLERALKGEEVDFTESYPLYGDELIIPTVSGLSLWIHNEGAAVLSLKYSHSLSEDFVTFSPKFRPGVSIANNMKMSIAGDIIEAGLRAETKLGASTDIALTGTLSVSDDHYGYEIRVAMPPTDVKLVDISNELFWTLQTRHADYDLKQRMKTLHPPMMDTGKKCAKYLPIITSIKACVQAQLPPLSGRSFPSFPLSGPGFGTFELSPPAGAKELVVKFKVTKPDSGGKERILSVEVDAPGSTENIKTAIRSVLVRGEEGLEKFSLELDAPSKKASISGERTMGQPGVNDFTYTVHVDGKDYKLFLKQRSSTDAATQVESKSYGIRYKLPHQEEITIVSLDLDRSLDGAPKIHHSLDFNLNDVNSIQVKEFISFSVSLDGELGAEEGKKFTALTKFSFYRKQLLTINGVFTRGQDSLLYESDAKFLLHGEGRDVKVNGEIGLSGPKRGVFKGTITSASRPKMNSDFELIRKWGPAHKEFGFNLKQKGPASEGGVLKILYTIDTQGGTTIIKSNSIAVYPPKDINYEKSYEVENGPEKSSLHFLLSSKNAKVAEITLIYNNPSSTYEANILTVFSGKKFILASENSISGGHHIFEHHVGLEPVFNVISVKTDLFESRDGEGVWKNRVTTVSSTDFPEPYLYELKYDVDARNPTHAPKLFTTGKGSLNVNVARGSTPLFKFTVVKQEDPAGQHTFKASTFIEKICSNNIEIKRNPEAKRIEITGSAQCPTGLKRTLKLVITGKDAGDAPGQTTFGFSFDLKTDGTQGPLNAILITNRNIWKRTPADFSLKSNNNIQVSGRTRIVNVELRGDVPVPGGELSLRLDFTNPEGKTGKLETSLETQNSDATKFIKVKHEFVGYSSAKTSGTFEFGVQKFNQRDNTGDVVTSYELNGRKEYELKLSNSKGPTGQVVVLTANGFGKIFEKAPIQSELRLEGEAGKYRIKFIGGYDDPNSTPVYFNFLVEKTPGTAMQKYVIDAAFDSRYKQEEGAEFSGKLTFAYRYNSATEFEFESTGLIQVSGTDGKWVYSFNRVIKNRPSLFLIDLSSKSERSGQPPLIGVAKINVQKEPYRVLVTVNLEHELIGKISGTGQTLFELYFETSKDVNNLVVIASAKLPSTKYGALSVRIQRKVSPDGTSRFGSLSWKLNDKKFYLDTNVVLTETKKSADITMKLNEDTPKTLSLKYDLAGRERSAEATYQWGDNGQVIKSTGSIANGPNKGFTAKFAFVVPSMEQEWNLVVVREDAAATKSFSFAATSPKSKQNLKLQLAKEGSRTAGLATWTATLNVDLAAPHDKYDIDGSFKAVLDKNSYVQGENVPGSSFTASIDYAVGEDRRSRSLTLDVGESAPETRLNGKLCLSKDNCFDLKTLLKDERLEKSFKLSLTSSEELAASVSTGYKISEDSQTRLTSFEYSFSDPTSKVKKELRIQLYKKPGGADDLELTKSDISALPSKVSTRGIEIEVPERTYGAQVACGDWNDVDTEAGEVSLWFDKKNSPNQKLILGFSKTRASVQEAGQGKDVILTLRHHKLQRDLKVKTKYRYGITSKVFDLKTEIDIFKTAEAKIILSAELTHDVPTETYGLQYGVKSAGQGFSVMTNCEGVKMDFPYFTATCTHSRKAPNAKDVNHKILIKTDEDEEFIQITEGDNNNVFYYKFFWNSGPLADTIDPTMRTSSASGATTELRLPGMTDTRIINFRWSRTPLRVTISTNPSSSKDVTSFWIGTTSVQGRGFGISRTDENGKKQELVKFGAAVRSKQLQIDFDWSKEAIASYLEYVLKRGQEVEQLATKTVSASNAQLWQSHKAIRKSLKEASQDFEPLLQWYETQLNAIGAKYNLRAVALPRDYGVLEERQTPPKSAFLSAIKGVNKRLSSCAASINGFLDSVSKQETLPTTEAVKARSLRVRQFAETVGNKIREFVAATKELKEKYPVLKKNARKLRQKMVDKLQTTYERARDDLNDLFPYPEVHHFLEHFNDYFEVALLEPEKISQANKTEMLGDLENAVEKVLSNSYSVNFSQGRISAKLPLLWKLEAFRQRQAPFQDFTDKEEECIKELFEDPSSILPPVNATAFIIGSTNFVTFDGTVGEFEKTCQFLMASDFVNKNLSVVFDHGDRVGEGGVGSTLFLTDHKTTVGVTRTVSKLQVAANGNVVALDSEPSRVGAFVIYQDGSYVMIEGDMGITLGCTTSFNLCAVQVSGFYHGKLQGLFGKYNNEPSDDYTLPTGQVTTNDGIFQKSWKMDQKCTGKVIRKSDQISRLYKALKRTSLDYDTFFSRSTYSPHLVVGNLDN